MISSLRAIRADGTTDVLAVLRSVARRPHELPALLRTALDARAARATLLRGRRLLAPRPEATGLRPLPGMGRELAAEGVQVDLRSAVG